MRILITGGLGFIGSHLCEALALASHELVIVDDLSTGKKEHAPAGAEVIIDDVARAGAFDEVVQGIDACFHLAAIASVELSRTHWLRTHEVNSGALVNLMAAISKTKRPVPVVFASSAAVYGNNAQLPLKEITSPAPISSYGVDKLSCEHNGQIAAHAHGIPNIGLRFFNVYGPRQDPSSPYSGVISIFSHAVLHRTPVTIYGDGEQSRDFIYVKDVVQALLASLQQLQNGNIRYDVFNICTGKSISVKTLAATLGTLSGHTPDIRHVPARNGDIRHSTGDPAYTKQGLGFTAGTPLADGLHSTLNWLKTQL